jgi:hypothetical protein
MVVVHRVGRIMYLADPGSMIYRLVLGRRQGNFISFDVMT